MKINTLDNLLEVEASFIDSIMDCKVLKGGHKIRMLRAVIFVMKVDFGCRV